MKISWSEPGVVISAAAHLTLLIAAFIAFSNANKFEDAQETIAVETVTNSQFNEIMKGEKTAKPQDKPQPKVDRVADAEVQKKDPPTAQAKVDVPAPPPPLRPTADPGKDDKPQQPPPPAPVAALPPPRPPDPVKADEPKPAPDPVPPSPPKPAQAAQKPPQDKPEAETIEPASPPAPKKEALATPPLPPARPRPRPPAKPSVDQIQKLLDEKRLEEFAAATDKPVTQPPRPPAKPKSGVETAKSDRKWDVSQIEQILSKDDPQSTGSTGRQLNKVAALGSPTASAERLSPTAMSEFLGYLQERYKECWSLAGGPQQHKYVPRIAADYNADGSLSDEPKLMNPPSDPEDRGLADSAVRAVHTCNPLRIPAQFVPYFDRWRRAGPILRFEPDDTAG